MLCLFHVFAYSRSDEWDSYRGLAPEGVLANILSIAACGSAVTVASGAISSVLPIMENAMNVAPEPLVVTLISICMPDSTR